MIAVITKNKFWLSKWWETNEAPVCLTKTTSNRSTFLQYTCILCTVLTICYFKSNICFFYNSTNVIHNTKIIILEYFIRFVGKKRKEVQSNKKSILELSYWYSIILSFVSSCISFSLSLCAVLEGMENTIVSYMCNIYCIIL